jgi:hypothetical protein
MEEEFTTEAEEAILAEQIAKLEKLGLTLAKTRSEAIDGRQSSGIEDIWLEDEEHYEGVDDANRGEKGAWRSKPAGQAELQSDEATGSTVFFNITRPYCDAGSARIGDMLLPTEDKGWAIKATPIPQLAEISEGKIPPLMKAQMEEDPRLTSPELMAKQVEQTKQDAEKMLEDAKKQAEKAEKRIEDWHVEAQYNAEMRQVIEDSGKIGTGIMKGPIPERKTSIMYLDGGLAVEEKLQPVSRRVDAWNCFPDPGCGQDIHKGAYHWERDEISVKELQALIGVPGYIESQIQACIDEEPHKAIRDFSSEKGDQKGLIKRESASLYEIWYGYCTLKKDELEAAGCECEEDQIDVCVTLVNNRVIKAAPNYMDTGEFPYDYMPWQRRTDSPWGIGIARQIRTPQRVVNGAARNLMDNAGLAGGPMWVFLSGIVEPIDGIYEIAPRKGWQAAEDADIADIQKAFAFITMPMVQEDLQAIIQLGLKMAEDVTGLPMLLQGQQGNAPDTLGGTQIVNNNASTVLRRIARLWDDLVTEPHIRRYYRYLLQYGESDDEKGDFTIEARGSSALVERDVQNQSIVQMANIAGNPIYGIDPKKWGSEFLKSQRLDPNNFNFDDEEWEKIVKNMSQPQKQDSSLQIAEMRGQIEQLKIQASMQDKDKQRAHDEAEGDKDREIEIELKSIDQQIESKKVEDNLRIENDKLKAKLAEVASKLRVQKELSATEVITPIAEPKPIARPGHSFEE